MSCGQELKRISVAKKTVAFPWCQLHGNYCPLVGSLSNYDGYNNENGKKAIGLDWRNTTLHVHHALLYISLPSQHDYDVKCLISRFLEGVNTTYFFFSWTSIALQNSTPETIANIWRIERDGINAIKFEAARMHFLRDVFAAVAVVVA